jgi:hypothetical protein
MYLTVRIVHQTDQSRSGLVIQDNSGHKTWFDSDRGINAGLCACRLGFQGMGDWQYDLSLGSIELFEVMEGGYRYRVLSLRGITSQISSFQGGESGRGYLYRNPVPNIGGDVDWQVLGAYPGQWPYADVPNLGACRG